MNSDDALSSPATYFKPNWVSDNTNIFLFCCSFFLFSYRILVVFLMQLNLEMQGETKRERRKGWVLSLALLWRPNELYSPHWQGLLTPAPMLFESDNFVYSRTLAAQSMQRAEVGTDGVGRREERGDAGLSLLAWPCQRRAWLNRSARMRQADEGLANGPAWRGGQRRAWPMGQRKWCLRLKRTRSFRSTRWLSVLCVCLCV